jgi:hypothetical protein
MRKTILLALLTTSLAAPALADDYPVSGRWGVVTTSTKGAIDCTGKRVISFAGNQRRDTGSVPAYRNVSVTPDEAGRYRVVDIFTNAQMSSANVSYALIVRDADHIEMHMQPGGTLKLQRCK